MNHCDGRGAEAWDSAGAGVLPDSIEFTGDPARAVTLADPAAPLGVRFTGLDPTDRYPAP